MGLLGSACLTPGSRGGGTTERTRRTLSSDLLSLEYFPLLRKVNLTMTMNEICITPGRPQEPGPLVGQ